MDRHPYRTWLPGPSRTGGVDASTRAAQEYEALHDWMTEQARESAVTAEEHLLLDWRRHVDRLRHEQPRPLPAWSGVDGPAGRPGAESG